IDTEHLDLNRPASLAAFAPAQQSTAAASGEPGLSGGLTGGHSGGLYGGLSGGLAGPGPNQPLREAVDSFTRSLIKTTVAECSNNWAEAARRLGLQRGNLHRLASRLGVRDKA